MKKGDKISEIEVQSMAAEGRCIAHHPDGRVIFIEGCAPGDIVEIELTKIKSAFLEGRITQIQKYSLNRAQPFCQHFGTCGGCSWQHIEYPAQLAYKQQQVIDNLERLGGLTLPAITPILPSEATTFYRNKLDYTFSSSRWLTRKEMNEHGDNDRGVALGYHIPRFYDRVFDVQECFLQPQPSNDIRLLVKKIALEKNIPFFDLRKQIGFLRTLTIRTAVNGETMVILQVTYDQMEWIEKILEAIASQFPKVSSLMYVINGKKNDTFSDLNILCWKGNPYITETMTAPDGKSLQFRVGPKSFYQTNAVQAQNLYQLAWKMAALTGKEVVYDLYTGTGTIANFLAHKSKKVIGLEYVAAAIEDAKINSQLNNITNTEFYAGDMKDLLTPAFLSSHEAPDVIITDPPRAGMHESVTRTMLQANPARIVYVSCNPATQARDLKILTERYTIASVQPVDMFPHTVHVENVVSLERI